MSQSVSESVRESDWNDLLQTCTLPQCYSTYCSHLPYEKGLVVWFKVNSVFEKDPTFVSVSTTSSVKYQPSDGCLIGLWLSVTSISSLLLVRKHRNLSASVRCWEAHGSRAAFLHNPFGCRLMNGWIVACRLDKCGYKMLSELEVDSNIIKYTDIFSVNAS